MCDASAVDFEYLVAMTTRVKIHHQAVVALVKIKRFQIADLTRMRRLVSIHISQIKSIEPDVYKRNLRHYSDIVTIIERKMQWLAILLEKRG